MNSQILSAEEVEKIKQENLLSKQTKDTEQISQPSTETFSNCAKVNFNSDGRFNTPSTMYFKGYKSSDVNDLVMSGNKPETIFETTASILNRLKFGKDFENVDCYDMTIEEFIETLIAIKRKYINNIHKHTVICTCQEHKDPKDRSEQTIEIDLNKLQYRHITQADENLKNSIKEELDLLSDGEWKQYRDSYASSKNIESHTVTKEDIINNVLIKEPFVIHVNDHAIMMRLPRVRDVIQGIKLVDKEFTPLMMKVENRVEHGVPGDQLRAKKQKELEQLQEEKAKKMILYSKALSIISLDGKELSDKEKIQLIDNSDIISIGDLMNLNDILNEFKFGVYQEIEFTCPICGSVNKELLQHTISFTELLPVDSNNGRNDRKFSRLDFHFGA